MQNTIAILVVNHNYGRFVQNTIESIWAQNYPDLALVICDDASNDNSWNHICSSMETKAARFTRTEIRRTSKNQGKNAWINFVAKDLPEKSLVILDSDDTIPEDYVNTLSDELSNFPNVDFVYTDCDLLDAEGNKIGIGRSRDFDASLVDLYSYIPEPALMKTGVLRRALPLDEGVRSGTKHEKYKRIVHSGGIGKHTDRTRFNYRMHDANLSGIGARVLLEVASGITNEERLLSGYWPTSNRSEE